MEKKSSRTTIKPLSIGIDARAVTEKPAGKGRYVLGLLEGWASLAPTDQLTIYSRPGITRPPAWPDHWQLVETSPSIRGSLWLNRHARARGVTALLASSNYSLAVVARLPTVTVVYDIAVFVVPEARPSLRVRLAERLLLIHCLRRSAHLLTISNFTRRELVEYFYLPIAKISVAAPAVDARFHPSTMAEKIEQSSIRQRYHLPERFLLFVSTLEPRKNLVRLLEAFADWDHDLAKEYPLILVGRLGWSTAEILAHLGPLEAKGLVRHLDYVANQDLPLIYQAASGVVFPSLYEGFGLPALEALASGVPLLTTETSSLPEVVGEAALQVDPYQVAAIRQGLTRLVTDGRLRAELIRRGPIRAAQFSWLKTATAAREALLKVVRKS